jgi:hypothetical protein
MDEKEFFVVNLEMGNVEKATSLEEAMKLVQVYLDDGDLEELDDCLIFEGKQIKLSQKLMVE